MLANRRRVLAGIAGAALAPPGRLLAQAAPTLRHAFTVQVQVARPVELGQIDGGQRRFVPITGGSVQGPRLTGDVMPYGGDWQDIRPGGLTEVFARYFLKAADGTVIGVENSGVRVASEAVTADLARGVPVDPGSYYFRTTPRFDVVPGPHGWLRSTLFVATGIRRPDLVQITIFSVD
jgi:hypothetical protein